MKYILNYYTSTEYWFELDDDSVAIRQIVFENGHMQISCKTDCLAEGEIDTDSFSGKVINITADLFETRWRESLSIYQKDWQNQKVRYPVGTAIVAKVMYFYPQGAVLQLKEAKGICVAEGNLQVVVILLKAWWYLMTKAINGSVYVFYEVRSGNGEEPIWILG